MPTVTDDTQKTAADDDLGFVPESQKPAVDDDLGFVAAKAAQAPADSSRPDFTQEALSGKLAAPAGAPPKVGSDLQGTPQERIARGQFFTNPRTGQRSAVSDVPETEMPMYDPARMFTTGPEQIAGGTSAIKDNFIKATVPPQGKNGQPVTPEQMAETDQAARKVLTGTADTLRGVGDVSMPLIAGSLAAAPIPTAAGFALGTAASEGGGAALHGKVTPEEEDAIRAILFFAPGAAATMSGLESSYTRAPGPRGTRVGQFSAFGDKVAGGVRVSPEDVTIGARVGPVTVGKKFSRGFSYNEAPPSQEAPVSRGNLLPAGNPKYPAPGATPAPPTEGEKAMIDYERANGNIPTPPPKPVQTPSQQAGLDNKLSGQAVDAIAQTIAKAKPEDQNALIEQAHQRMVQWIADNNGKVFIDGKIHLASNPAAVEGLAAKIINDASTAHDKATDLAAKQAEKAQAAAEKQKTAKAAPSSAPQSTATPAETPAKVEAQPKTEAVQTQPEAEKPQHDFASTQVNIDPQSELGQQHAQAVAAMPDDHIGPNGKEDTPHVTVRYGLKDDSPEAIAKIKEAASKIAPFEATVGKTGSFPATKEGDRPIIAHVDQNPELDGLRSAVEGAGDFKPDTHGDYKPHVTLGYVKPEHVAKYEGGSHLEGGKVPVDHVTVTKRDGTSETIKLGGKPVPDLVAQHEAQSVPEKYPFGSEAHMRKLVSEEGRNPGREGEIIHPEDSTAIEDEEEYFRNFKSNLPERGIPAIEGVIPKGELTSGEPDLVAEHEGRRAVDRGDDRREDIQQRKRVSELTPEERAKELLTSEAVDLPNKRAFMEKEQDQKAPAVAMSDADGLKAFNDKYGYEAGSSLLRAKAESLKEAGLDSYHDKGDEFLHRGQSTGDLKAKLEQARESLRNKEFTVTDATGRKVTLKGVDFSYGTGPDLATAESGLKSHKSEREARGERARGELRGITEVGSQAADHGGAKEVKLPEGIPAKGKAGEFDLDKLTLAPKEFQYKLNTNERGVTNLLAGQKFNPELAGVISVWHNPENGKTYVVNGHHRVQLAKQSGVSKILVRHLNVDSASEARARGALQNIAEGRGTAVDAAKFFRERGITPADLEKHGISMGEATAENGLALSKLDPYIFDKVVSGELSQGRGIAIGKATENPATQEAILKLITKAEKRGRRITDGMVSYLANEANRAGETTTETGGLFGNSFRTENNALNKAEVSDDIRSQIVKEKRVFGAVSTEGKAEVLGQLKGQNIKAGENQKIALEASQAAELYDKLSSSRGPIDDIIENAAQRIAKGENRATVKADAYKQVRTELRKALPGSEGPSIAGLQGRPAAGKETERAADRQASVVESPPKQETEPERRPDTGGIAVSGHPGPGSPEYEALRQKLAALESRKPVETKGQALVANQAKKTADRLRTVADGLDKQIEDKQRPMTQNATPKRMREYRSRFHDGENMKRVQLAMRALADAHEQGNVPKGLENLRTKDEIYRLAYKGVEGGGGYYDVIPSPHYANKTPQGKALQELMEQHKNEPSEVKKEREKASKISQLEADVQFQKLPGYFPTPKAIVEQMLDRADIKPGDKVLEPSAGKGNIADLIKEREPEAHLSTIEQQSKLRQILELKGHSLVDYDFTQHEGEYDKILMNPPFENGQDIDHVQRAFGMLKPGGKLVAIMSESPFFRSDRKGQAFREWLEEHGGTSEKLPEGSFKESGTGVNARMVEIDKPQAPERQQASVTAPSDRAELRKPKSSSDEPALPGMAPHVEANKESAAATQGEELSHKLTEQPKSVSSKTGEMERNSPLFRDSEASGQGGLFGGTQSDSYLSDLAGDTKNNEIDRSVKGKKSERGFVRGDLLTGIGKPDGSPKKTVPTFFSKAEKVAAEKLPNSILARAVVPTLKSAGVKNEELKWLGLDEWLNGKARVTKQEVLDHIRQNNVQVKEVEKSDSAIKPLKWKRSTSGYGKETWESNKKDIYIVKTDFAGGETQFLLNTRDGATDYDSLEEAKRAADQHAKDSSRSKTATKFSQYQMPGGENYRELLLTLPEDAEKFKASQSSRVKELSARLEDLQSKRDDNSPWTERENLERQIRNTRVQLGLAQAETRNPSSFHSSHFDEPNVLAHVRFNDRISPDGKKTLFMEELQSDWHQKGRKEGYADNRDHSARIAQIDAEADAISERLEKLEKIDPNSAASWQAAWDKHPELKAQQDALYRERGRLQNSGGGVPDAPFKSTWHELAMKRMLRYAAENGYDKLAWTTGDQQAQRYDLSKHVDGVEWNQKTGDFYASKGGTAVITKHGVKGSELADIIGKEAAQKLADKEPHANGNRILKGLELQVGGSGMKGFYDKILPDFMNKYGKRWGAKVGETQIPTLAEKGKGARAPYIQERHTTSIDGQRTGYVIYDAEANQIGEEHRTRDAAEDALNNLRKNGTPVHSISITPEMRDSVMHEGQAMYAHTPLSLAYEGAKKLTEAVAPPVVTFLHETSEKTAVSRSVDDKLFSLGKQYEADVLRAVQLMKQVGPLTTPEEQADIYHHLEDSKVTLSPKEQAFLDKIIKPMMQQSSEIRAKLNDAGVPMGEEGYVHRVVQGKNSQLERAMAGKKGTGKGNILSKAAASLKQRTMFALEDEEGNRVVISRKDGRISSHTEGGSEDMGSAANIKTQDAIDNEKIARLGKKITELKRQQSLLKTVKGRVIGNSTVHGVEPSFKQRAKLTEKIYNLEKQKEALESAPANSEKIFTDHEGKEWRFTQATTKEIEANTSLTYYKNATASAVTDYLQLLRAKRANDALESMKADPEFKELSFKSENGSMPPEGWRTVNLPQFKGYYFEPHIAEVLDRFEKELHPDPPTVLEKIGNFMTSTLLLNPVRHIYNIGNHWLVERGVSGAFNPLSWPTAYRAGVKAIKAVVNQNEDFLSALDKGAPMMSHRTDLQELHQQLFQTIVGHLEKNPTVMDKIAEFSGYSPTGPEDKGIVSTVARGTGLRMLNNIRKLGQKAMWQSNDMFMLQSSYEKMAKDPSLSFEDAMAQTAKHIPDYRIPTRIMNSKAMADFMGSRLASMFGRYHYGVWKSYWEMAKEAVDPNASAADRLRGLNHLAMLGFLTFIAYKLWDEVLKKITHDNNAKMVRSGASAIPGGIEEVLKGDKPASTLIRGTFTPAIFPQTAAEVLFNRDFFTGGKVYKDHTDTKKQAEDIGKHFMNSLGPVQQYNQSQRSGHPLKNLLLGQVGVNTNHPKKHH